MILDSVSSFIDNLKTKVSNPFFGTLLAVWLVRNWNLVYGLFIFDDDCGMDDKFEFVRNHFKGKNIYNELWINISTTFSLLILGYILLIASRFLANLVEHRITPIINTIAASKLVANKDVLNELEIQLLKKTSDLINERKLVNELELQLVDIRGRVDTATSEKKSAISKLSELTKQNTESKQSIELLDTNNKKLKANLAESRNMGSNLIQTANRYNVLNAEHNISLDHLNCYLDLWNFNLVEAYDKIVSVFDVGEKKYKTNELSTTLIKTLNEHKILISSFNTNERTTTLSYTESGEEFAKIFYKLKTEFTKPNLPW